MGLRSNRLKAAATTGKKSPTGCIIMAIIPLALLIAWMSYVTLSGQGPGSPASKQAVADQRARHQTVAEIINSSGASYSNTAYGSTITLSATEALTITPREATELALTAYQRTGQPVKIKSPAGQILAEAP